MPALFGDLFKSTRVEVVQSVTSEQLEEVLKWLVAGVNAVSEAQQAVNVQAMLDRVDQLAADNEKAKAELLTLRAGQAGIRTTILCFL